MAAPRVPAERFSSLLFQLAHEIPMADARSTIFVVDDDASVRDAISNLLESVGLRRKVFASTEAFWKEPRPDVPSCLVLDVRLPGANGLDFQESLPSTASRFPSSLLPRMVTFP